jgi:4-hydroxybutyrate dehydrogenase / sulfolactaldehyde 3-reductase
MDKRRLGFLGLGNMGGGMVTSLHRAGFAVTAYDPVTQLLQAAAKQGIEPEGSPREVGMRADVVLSSLPTPKALEEAVLGPDGLIHGLSPGKTFIDLSTIDPVTSLRVHEALAAKGVRMLDCPVGRGPEDAAKGELILMVGGDPQVLEEVRGVLGALGSAIHHCGPAGSGAAAKLVNNLVSCALCALNGEALVLAAKAGVDLDVMLEIMTSTAADNRHLRITAGPRTLDGNFAPRFRVALAEKDLRLAVQMGLEMGVPTPMADAAHLVHRITSSMGLADEDQGAVIKLTERAAGIEARRRAR